MEKRKEVIPVPEETNSIAFSSPPRRGRVANLSMVLASVALLFALSGVFVCGTRRSYDLCQTCLLLTLASPLVTLAAIGAALAARANPRAQTARKLGFGALALLGMRLLIFPFEVPPCGERIVAKPTIAVGSLRSINAACGQYVAKYGGYPPSLGALGPVAAGESPSSNRADLIDQLIASGQKSGYRFIYVPGEKDSQGRVRNYSVMGQPAEFNKYNDRNFFTDQTGVIRSVRENRPATAQDPPI